MKNDDKIDMFEGFWKYVGVVFSCALGGALTLWGINILMNDWIPIRTLMGPLGNIVLVPLMVGPALVVMGMIEFMNILKRNRGL